MKKSLLFAYAAVLATNAFAAETAITEQPEGELRTYLGTSYAHEWSSWGFPDVKWNDGLARKVVFAENGDVYFKNPLTLFTRDSWIKGTLEDGVITVKTPQLLYTDPDDGTNWYLACFNGEPTFEGATDVEDMTWTIDRTNDLKFYYRNDSIIEVNQNYDYMIGLMLNDKYMYWGEQQVTYARVSETAAKIPEGALTEDWTMRYNDTYTAPLKVSFEGDDMFVQGLWPDYPQACIKGTIEGTKVSFPSQQYLGFLGTADGEGHYTYFCTTQVDWRMVYLPGYVTTVEPLEFTYDAEKRSMTQLSPEKIFATVQYGKRPGLFSLYPVATFGNMTISANTTETGRPKLPTIDPIFGLSYYPATGWGRIEFDMVAFDENDKALDPDYLYYSIWTDGEVFVFDPEDAPANNPTAYEGIEEPMTEIPYTFLNDKGIASWGAPTNRRVNFYRTGFDEIGVQSIYKHPETGEVLKSDILYINTETKEIRQEEFAGVESVGYTGDVESIVVYDTFGRVVDSSYKGVVIEVVRFTNGTSQTTKKVQR